MSEEIKNKIQNLIKENKIKMIPRWHFVLKSFLVIASVFVLGMLSIFIFSLSLFKNRMIPPGNTMMVIGNMEILGLLIVGFLMLIVLAALLLHANYAFIYSMPIIALAFVILFIVLIASYILDNFKMHDRARNYFKMTPMPGIERLYIDDNEIKYRDTHPPRPPMMGQGTDTLMMERIR